MPESLERFHPDLESQTEKPKPEKRSAWASLIDLVERFQKERKERLRLQKEGDLQSARTQTETISLVTDHTLKEYQTDLQFDIESFRGKTILDIGSGEQETFSKEAEKFDVRVISLNPKLREQESRDWLLKRPGWQERSVAGRAQQLPFKNDSFDAIVARWSISHYLHEDELILAIEQAYALLKPGGIILLTPTYDISRDIVDKLKYKGINMLPHGKYSKDGANVAEITKPLNQNSE